MLATSELLNINLELPSPWRFSQPSSVQVSPEELLSPLQLVGEARYQSQEEAFVREIALLRACRDPNVVAFLVRFRERTCCACCAPCCACVHWPRGGVECESCLGGMCSLAGCATSIPSRGGTARPHHPSRRFAGSLHPNRPHHAGH